MKINNNVKWNLSIVLFAIQLLVVLLFINLLWQDLGWFAFVIPTIIVALIAGMYIKTRIGFLLGFVWSVLLFIHSGVLIFVQFHPLQILYLGFALVQCYVVSQTRIEG